MSLTWETTLVYVYLSYIGVRATGLKKLIPEQPMKKYIQRMRRTLKSNPGGNVGIG